MSNYQDILKNIIAERRTVKPNCFTGEKIDDSVIKQILESANWAPTHGYTEPWRFTVFAEEGLAKLADFYSKLDQPDPNAEDFNVTRFERLKTRSLKCSHVIGIGMKKGDNPKVPEIEEICSVAMAVQNMWLTVHSLGLAGYWSTGSLAFTDEMRDFFGLSEGDRSLGLFYLGKSAEPHPAGRRVNSIEEKVRWVR